MAYEIIKYNARLWVKHAGRLLGGYNTNELRSYVFPLYTPKGVLVLQEAPPDHPHHQGIMVGLEVDGHDLWNAGSRNLPRHRQEALIPLAELQAEVTVTGVQVQHGVRWATVDGAELLLEQRTITFRAHAQFTTVHWQSTFSHPNKRTHLGQTKESGIGVRVPPHWETPFGGAIRNANGALGEKGCFDQLSPWLNIEGSGGAEANAGVVLIPATELCPWFTRDYGLHVYNPARHHTMTLAPGEQVTWAMTVLAYDGWRSIDAIKTMIALLDKS